MTITFTTTLWREFDDMPEDYDPEIPIEVEADCTSDGIDFPSITHAETGEEVEVSDKELEHLTEEAEERYGDEVQDRRVSYWESRYD